MHATVHIQESEDSSVSLSILRVLGIEFRLSGLAASEFALRFLTDSSLNNASGSSGRCVCIGASRIKPLLGCIHRQGHTLTKVCSSEEPGVSGDD